MSTVHADHCRCESCKARVLSIMIESAYSGIRDRLAARAASDTGEDANTAAAKLAGLNDRVIREIDNYRNN